VSAALRRASLVDRDVSAAGVLAFLAWSYIPPPLTWLRNVESLAPGTWKRWHDGGRIEAGTFVVAAAMTGSDFKIENVIMDHLGALRDKLAECGVFIHEEDLPEPLRPLVTRLLEPARQRSDRDQVATSRRASSSWRGMPMRR